MLWFALVCSLLKGSESGCCIFLIDSFFNVRNESHVHARGLQLSLAWPGLACASQPCGLILPGSLCWGHGQALEGCLGTVHGPPQSQSGRASSFGKPLVALCLSHFPVSCRWQLLRAAAAISPPVTPSPLPRVTQAHPRRQQPLAPLAPTAPVRGTAWRQTRDGQKDSPNFGLRFADATQVQPLLGDA